jgi:ribosomal protein L11 methyltransferase
MTMAEAVWRVLARVSGAAAADAVFSLLDDVAGTVSAFETSAEEWRLEAYPPSPALTPDLAARLALAAAAAGGTLVELGEDKLPPRDWLAENQLAFPPMRVGRFFIYGSHHRGRAPSGSIAVAVDAATAFGTGEHPSTRGCLIALESLAQRRRFRRPLDVGTGTGILAIAAARLLRRRVLASDIDAGAVNVARHNVARNGVTRLVQIHRAPGYHDRALRGSRYDLILSNILARPLAVLAPDLARALTPGGHAVLSGLLRRQEAIVLAPHRSRGIALERRIVIDGWSTLILRRGLQVSEVAMGAEAPISEFGSVESPVRLPSAGRIAPGLERRRSARTGRAREHPRPGRRFVNGEFRYRQANDRRASSTRHRHAAGGANRKSPSGPK